MPTLPYKIAALCYLFDDQGRLLLLHRAKYPNKDLYSPIGGKLDMEQGESPAACALREIWEEAEIRVDPADLHLAGLVSECGFNNETHWLMFLYEVTRPVKVTRTEFEEGRLEWHEPDRVPELNIPETDRRVIWPLFLKHRGGFFHVHIDCRDDHFNWRLESPATSSVDAAAE
jgi:8-oxo-dGTP diphosphatase